MRTNLKRKQLVVGVLLFIKHTGMCWGIDTFYKNKYRPVAKNHYPSILSRASKTRKSMNMSISSCKKGTPFFNTLSANPTKWSNTRKHTLKGLRTNSCGCFFLSGKQTIFPTNIYLFKVNIKNTRKRCEICSKFIIKTPEQSK